MADHGLPTLTSTYSDFLSQLDARLDDLAKMLDEASLVNLPVGAIRWDSSLNTWRKWSGSSWANLSTGYAINISGSVTGGTGSFTTLSTSSTTSLAAGTTIGGAAAVTTTGTQTLTNKTLTSPVISSISNTGTITLPTSTTTLVGTDTIDTLTNKTLTAPKFANGGFIADANGNEVLRFSSVASAVNYIDVLNSAADTSVQIRALGDSTNISLNLVSKGIGQVTINGTQAVDISSAQNLTNKTLATGSTWNGNAITREYGGTGNTTAFNQGGVTYASSASTLTTTAAGTAGQVLTSQGTGAPIWANISGVSSINGQTGAVTQTTVGNIGSYVVALFIAEGTHPGTDSYSANVGDSVQGAQLRYNYQITGIQKNDFNGYYINQTSAYAGGGTNLTGTWRCMARPCYTFDSENGYYWWPGLFVRVS